MSRNPHRRRNLEPRPMPRAWSSGSSPMRKGGAAVIVILQVACLDEENILANPYCCEKERERHVVAEVSTQQSRGRRRFRLPHLDLTIPIDHQKRRRTIPCKSHSSQGPRNTVLSPCPSTSGQSAASTAQAPQSSALSVPTGSSLAASQRRR